MKQTKGALKRGPVVPSGDHGKQPIALGVLKIKARLGELMPAKQPSEKGRGKKNGNAGLPFSKPTVSAYRKLAANRERLEEGGKKPVRPNEVVLAKAQTLPQAMKQGDVKAERNGKGQPRYVLSKLDNSLSNSVINRWRQVAAIPARERAQYSKGKR